MRGQRSKKGLGSVKILQNKLISVPEAYPQSSKCGGEEGQGEQRSQGKRHSLGCGDAHGEYVCMRIYHNACTRYVGFFL